MADYLHFINKNFGVDILAFVLMGNHFHLLARFPEANLGESMRYFMRETSRQITYSSGRINQTYGSRFFRSLIGSPHYYLHAYKYVYRNPVDAGLCSRAEDYAFSSLSGLVGRTKLPFPISEDDTLFNDLAGTLAWINTTPPEAHRQIIRKSLRRQIFKVPLDRTSGTAHALEQCLF